MLQTIQNGSAYCISHIVSLRWQHVYSGYQEVDDKEEFRGFAGSELELKRSVDQIPAMKSDWSAATDKLEDEFGVLHI